MIFKKSNFNFLKIPANGQPITMIGLPRRAIHRFLRFFFATYRICTARLRQRGNGSRLGNGIQPHQE